MKEKLNREVSVGRWESRRMAGQSFGYVGYVGLGELRLCVCWRGLALWSWTRVRRTSRLGGLRGISGTFCLHVSDKACWRAESFETGMGGTWKGD